MEKDVEKMEITSTSSPLIAHPSLINNELPIVCKDVETCAEILEGMKNTKTYSKIKSKSRRKKMLKKPNSNYIIQIFECRSCHQTFTSIEKIGKHTKSCKLTQYRTYQQDFTNLNSYLKINLKCVH